MTRTILTLLAAAASVLSLPTQATQFKELLEQNLADYPGQEGLMLEVAYKPGEVNVAHRHNAHAFIYVLEGEMIMQLKGKDPVHLKAGQTYYEGPEDIHVVDRNASTTAPARFVVVLLKKTGAPVLMPVQDDRK